MDNKRVYKRISTCFWFLLASLPVWVALIGYIGQYIGGIPDTYSGNSMYTPASNYYRSFSYYFTQATDNFLDMIPGFIKLMFYNLCDYIDEDMVYPAFNFMSWFVWVYFIELLIDFIIWLPRFFHSILEKGMDKLS